LLHEGQLHAIVDFGQMSVGDPACDLAITWTLFHGKSRDIFRSMLSLDAGTRARGRGWALRKALIMAAGLADPHNIEAADCWLIPNEVWTDA